MSDITTIKQGELEVMFKASIFLREKLLKNDRNGPLVKLLTREIDLFSDELARRRPTTKTQETEAVVIKQSPTNQPTTSLPASLVNGNYDGKTTILPKKTAPSSTGKLNEPESIPAQKPTTPIQRPTLTQPQSQQPVRGLLSKVTQTQPVINQSDKIASSKQKTASAPSPKAKVSTSTETVIATDK